MSRRGQFAAAGAVLSFFWFCCNAVTIADESRAVMVWRWTISQALIGLAGAAFGAAAVTKPPLGP